MVCLHHSLRTVRNHNQVRILVKGVLVDLALVPVVLVPVLGLETWAMEARAMEARALEARALEALATVAQVQMVAQAMPALIRTEVLAQDQEVALSRTLFLLSVEWGTAHQLARAKQMLQFPDKVPQEAYQVHLRTMVGQAVLQALALALEASLFQGVKALPLWRQELSVSQADRPSALEVHL